MPQHPLSPAELRLQDGPDDLPIDSAERARLVAQLVREHMRLARSLASRYRERGEPLEDLVQVAYLGLVTAAQHFRPGEGESFAAYAVPTITGELRRYFRDKGWYVRPPRRLQETRAAVHQAEDLLTHRFGRHPSEDEIAGFVGVPAAEVAQSRLAAAGYSALSLSAPSPGSDEPVRAWAEPAASEPSGAERLDVLVDSVSLAPLLRQLPPREQRILALRFYQGCTQQQIADQLGVTQMQVSRLLTQSLRRLRSALADEEAVGA